MKDSFFICSIFFSFFCFGQAPTIQWQDAYGGSQEDVYKCVISTTDGGYIATGTTYSVDGDVEGNHGGYDLILVKYNSSGTILWKKTYGGSDYDHGYAVRQTSDGGFVVCGYSYSTDGDAAVSHADGDYWILKIDALGNLQWQKSYGGNSFDCAYDIRQTTDGGYIVIGESHSSQWGGDLAHQYGNDDVWVIKLTASGNLVWEKNYGGTGEDTGYTILQMADGNYVFSATTNSVSEDVVGLHDLYNYTGFTLIRTFGL